MNTKKFYALVNVLLHTPNNYYTTKTLTEFMHKKIYKTVLLRYLYHLEKKYYIDTTQDFIQVDKEKLQVLKEELENYKNQFFNL